MKDIALLDGQFKVAIESTAGVSSYNIFIAPSAHQAPSVSKKNVSGPYVRIWDERALNDERFGCAPTIKGLGKRGDDPSIAAFDSYFIEKYRQSQIPKVHVDIQRAGESVMHWSCDWPHFGPRAVCQKLTNDRRHFLRVDTIYSVETLEPVLKLDESFLQFMKMADDWPYSEPTLTLNKRLKELGNGPAAEKAKPPYNRTGSGILIISDDLKRIVRLPRGVFDGVMALVYHTDTKTSSRIVAPEFVDTAFNSKVIPEQYSENGQNRFVLYRNYASKSEGHSDYFVYSAGGRSQRITFSKDSTTFFVNPTYWDVANQRFLSAFVDGNDVTVSILDYRASTLTRRLLCPQPEPGAPEDAK